MGRIAMLAGALTVGAVFCHQSQAVAQTLVEVRVAQTKYRYVDGNYTFGNSAVVDVFYVGTPGSNEFNLGGGYAFKRGAFVLTPLLYVVFDTEGSERGAKVALLAAFGKDGWNLLSFFGQYVPISGTVRSYQVLDTLDFTRTIGTRWEAGVQAGFFHASDAWNAQIGPVLKRNDHLGAWAASYRFGDQNEFRVGRVLTF